MNTLHPKHFDSSKEESIRLINEYRNGNEKSRDELISNYLLFVIKESKKFVNTGVPMDDIVSEGLIGLMISIDKYDSEKGPFSTYARFWIRQSIIRNCIHKRRIIRLPENISELMRTGRWNGIEYKEMYIDSLSSDESTGLKEIEDKFSAKPFENENEKLMMNKIEKFLSVLDEREVNIVKAAYGIGMEKSMSIIEISKMYNLSTTRINQVIRNSIRKMRSETTSIKNEKKCIKKNIISAVYGVRGNEIDVTGKVKKLYELGEEIKVSNKLGGDPCKGSVKKLVIKIDSENGVISKKFSEGTYVKL